MLRSHANEIHVGTGFKPVRTIHTNEIHMRTGLKPVPTMITRDK
jgi:hypothetical protein